MTGSESPNSVSKGGPPTKQRQQRGTSTVKIEIMAPADKLRRLAIKNSFGKNKSLSPSSPLSKALSSSTSSLDSLTGAYPFTEPTEVDAVSHSCKMQLDLADGEHGQPRNNAANGKYAPYISRQELIHSLRRTSSNHSVGLTQTICTGNSSYIYHTPRHLMRTHFNPKAALARSGTATPDSGLWTSDVISGEKIFERESCDETQSLVGVSSSSSHGRSSPMVVPRRSKQRQRRPLYVGVEMTDSPRTKDGHQVLGEKTDRSKTALETSPLRGPPDHGPGCGQDRLPIPGPPQTLLSRPKPRSPHHEHHHTPQSGVYSIGTHYRDNHHSTSSSTPSPTTSPTGSTQVSPRHNTTPAGDRKIKLHIPQGRKTASLV